jgi:predicted nucleic-acid-binding protein
VIGLDTNVLVRYLTRDDETQFRAASTAITAAIAAGERTYICLAVLLETVWVLDRAYGVDRAGIARTLQGLLETADTVLENEPLVEAALDASQAGRADFADYVISLGNLAAGCRHTLTFDDRAGKSPGFSILAGA